MSADDRQFHYAVIADVVSSRQVEDRRALHQAIVTELARINQLLPAQEPLAITVGDEFQGVYGNLGSALRATLLARLALLPIADTRYGIGHGTITRLQQSPPVQDGPAWWAAREALEAVEEDAQRAATGARRTGYRAGTDAHGHAPDLEAAVNAALHCRDHLVESLSPRSRRLLEGLMAGNSQRELATAEGISASAVSQRIRKDGIAMLMEAENLLGSMS